ncbi:MAG: hypothetical protein LBC53_06275 [Spirochaetaceae bacterium]|jgi:hypothetical protein|nr:hypothetical protein [Spirochaetaceae bacterium]
MDCRKRLRRFYSPLVWAAAVFSFGFFTACEMPKGMDLKSDDWKAHIPVGTANLETEGDGFSLGKLKAGELQTMLGESFEGKVYDGYEKDPPISTAGEKRIYAKVNYTDNNATLTSNVIDAKGQQTYLIHYPVPLQRDMKKSMRESFNKALDKVISDLKKNDPSYGGDDGFVEQLPVDQPLEVPVTANSKDSADPNAPQIEEINDLQYDVSLTFEEGGLPREDGTGAVISESNKNKFINWVNFTYGKDANLKPKDPAVEIILNLKENQITWRSPKVTATDSAGDELELIKVHFDLLPKMEPQPRKYGIKYKIDLDLYDFSKAIISFKENRPDEMGDTSAFSDLLKMLGGVEFKEAYALVFSQAAINQSQESDKGVYVYATPPPSAAPNHTQETLVNGTLTANPLNLSAFYVGASASPANAVEITPSSGSDISKTLLGKGAPVYKLSSLIKAGAEIEISGGTGVDVVLLVPLNFDVTPGDGLDDAKAVTVANDNYLKLKVDQIDNILGYSGGDEFDLRSKTESFGRLKEAKGTLKVYNKVLPEDFFIGFEKKGEAAKYENLVNLKDGETSKIMIDLESQKVSVPKPALLLKATKGQSAEFNIAPIDEKEDATTTSIQIIVDVTMDLQYQMDF